MPNDFHGPTSQWEALEMPLRALDVELRAFAQRNGAAFTTNSRNWPDRSIIWGNSIRRLVQIYLADESRPTYSLWLCASEDRGGKRYWKEQFLREAVPIAEIAADLPDLLEQGRSLLEAWTSGTLEFATALSPNSSGRA
jgi:hypothetical protein